MSPPGDTSRQAGDSPRTPGPGWGGGSQALPGLASRPFSPPPPQPAVNPSPPKPHWWLVPCHQSWGGGGARTPPPLSLSLQMHPRSHPSSPWWSPGGGGRPSCSAPSTASHPPASPCAGVPASHPWSPRGARPSRASPSGWPPTPCGWRWGGWSCGTRGSTSARPTTATAPRPRPCTWTWEVSGGPEPWPAPYRGPGGSSCGTVALRSLSGGLCVGVVL